MPELEAQVENGAGEAKQGRSLGARFRPLWLYAARVEGNMARISKFVCKTAKKKKNK